jgi:hypothetical protein
MKKLLSGEEEKGNIPGEESSKTKSVEDGEEEKMKKIGNFFFLWMVLSVLAFAQSITVTSPNGGENWVIGSTHGIRWDSTGLSGNVKIGLFKSGAHIGNIAEHQPFATGVDWHVGDPLLNGVTYGVENDYQIQVQSEVDWHWKDQSNNNFSISSFVSLPLDKPVDIGRLRLHLPDLVVCMSWDGKRPYLGGKKLVKVRIKNIGLGASLATDLNFYVEDIGTNLIQVPALTANGEFNYEHKFWWNTLGHKSVWLVVDYHMKNTEANEDNNAITGSINVISPGQDRYVAETNRCSDQN